MTAVGLALCFAPAGGAGAAATATCSHMNKTQIQPLVVTRVTKLTVTPVPGILYGSSARQVGQTCDFADTQTSNALTVVVIVGPSAARDTQAGYAPDPGHAGTGTVVATYC